MGRLSHLPVSAWPGSAGAGPPTRGVCLQSRLQDERVPPSQASGQRARHPPPCGAHLDASPVRPRLLTHPATRLEAPRTPHAALRQTLAVSAASTQSGLHRSAGHPPVRPGPAGPQSFSRRAKWVPPQSLSWRRSRAAAVGRTPRPTCARVPASMPPLLPISAAREPRGHRVV